MARHNIIRDNQNKTIHLDKHKTMRKHFLSVGVVLTLAGCMLCTSCIGSFGLTNKLSAWNKQVSNKFVNEVVFFCFCIIPVYEVTVLADTFVLNSIEFWSGTNPIAQGTKVIDGKDGRYLVKCDGKGYTITSENDGTTVRLDFNEADQSWSVTANDQTYKFMTMVDDSHVKMLNAKGGYDLVELSDAGLMAYSSSMLGQQFALR
jgi:hypothetical protein